MSAETIRSEISFSISTGVKQEYVLTLTFFSILDAYIRFQNCKSRCENEVQNKGIFDIREFKAKTKTTEALIRDLVYADDCAIVTNSERDLQDLTDRLSVATSRYKLTWVLFQPTSRSLRKEPCILIDGQIPNNAKHFPFFGNSISAWTGITSLIAKAGSSFESLGNRAWYKKAVHQAMVLSSLLYCCELWTTYICHKVTGKTPSQIP